MSDFCPDCGEEVGGFSECGCFTTLLAPVRNKRTNSANTTFGGMRGMVSRKLKKQAAKKEKEVVG